MKVKVSDLSHNALCYAVCMIEMPHLKWGKTIGLHHASNQVVVPELREPDCYSPYTSWSMFGPIIERERIFCKPTINRGWRSYQRDPFGNGICNSQYGPTPLIAAMRCYVASKLGDEVEVPEELL